MGAVDRLVMAHEDGEVHEHLSHECPWYAQVNEGENPTDWAGCKAADGPASPDHGAMVKFTPHTGEASTVDKPTVPPGGPGLFHVKGLHLPPYIQHLWFHLVARYGKKRAYGIAVGVVKKWAAGINPGGKHPTKTHADVRAAAAKNVAEWESDRAKAHAQSASHDHVKASAGDWQDPSFPGQKILAVPPTPGDKVSKAMYTSHRVDDVIAQLAHASERLGEAKRVKSLRAYQMVHVNNHLSMALDDLHNLVSSVRKNYLPEARELAALNKTIGLAGVSVSKDAKVATFAHLLETMLYHLAHAKRHSEQMISPDPVAVWEFNYDHAEQHIKGGLEHAFKMARHLRDNYPEEAKWLKKLVDIEDTETDYTGLAEDTSAVALAVQNMGTATAPGAKPLAPPTPGGQYSQYGLNQKPSQTVSPSPPLPPSVPVPTPAEVRKILAQVPDSADIFLSNQAKVFLTQAAVKLQKNDMLAALHVLRSAQTALRASHRADVNITMPSQYTANVFTRIPPAEQSSANSAVLQSRERVLTWRRLEQETQALIDRILRRYFHGKYNGPSAMARLTEDGTMTALDKVLALAGQKVPAAKDVSFPTTTDTSLQVQPLQAPRDMLAQFQAQVYKLLPELSVLDRMRVMSYLDTANKAATSSPYAAQQSLARAQAIAFNAGLLDLAKYIHRWIDCLAFGTNLVPTLEEVQQEVKGHRNSPSMHYGANTRLSARLR